MATSTVTLEAEDNVSPLLAEATELVNSLGQLGVLASQLPPNPSDFVSVNRDHGRTLPAGVAFVCLDPSESLLEFVAALRALALEVQPVN